MKRILQHLDIGKIKLGGLVLALSLMSSVHSQYYNAGVQQEYFFGNLASVQSESMGRNDVAFGQSISQTFMNPAAINGVKNMEVHFSNSAPFYILRNSRYFYLGAAKRINEKLCVGLSLNSFILGKTTFDVTISGIRYPISKTHSTNVGGTVSYEIVKGLHLGTNINWYTMRLFEDMSPTGTLHLDAGLQYILPVQDDKNTIRFGLAVSNFTRTTLAFEAPNGDVDENYLPVLLRGGIAYVFTLPLDLPGAEKGDVQITSSLGLSDVLNNDFYFTYSGGMEALIYRVLAIRIGYFNRSRDNGGNPVNFSNAKKVTYGFGIRIPLNKISKGKLPFQTSLDYLSYRPALVSSIRTGSIPNKRTYNVNLNWD
jgi:hypothetical protein